MTGRDAVLVSECAGGSESNPSGCYYDKCPPGSVSCCRPQKALCRWAFSSPFTAGESFGFVAGRDNCTVPTPCGDAGYFQVVIASDTTNQLCGYSSFSQLSIGIKRPLTSPGMVISLPDSRVSVYWAGASINCSAWTGTVRWNSDVPSYSVSVDATCSEPGKGTLRFVGSAFGDI
jgi:hypothetical protein